MSQAKIDTCITLWKEDGYAVEVLETRIQNGWVMELEMKVRRTNGRLVDFFTDWPAMKALARRQDFYLLPARLDKHQIILINKRLILNRQKNIIDIRRSYAMTYWFLQNHERAEHFGAELIGQAFFIEGIRKDICKLGSCQYILFQSIQMSLYESYLTFKSRFSKVTEEMEQSGLFLEEELTRQLQLYKEYVDAD